MNYFYMNVSAAVIIIVTILIRKVTIHKIPHGTFGILWGLAALRMVVPFRITSSYCLYNLFFNLRDFLFAKGILRIPYKRRQILQLIQGYVDLEMLTNSLLFIWVIGFLIVDGYFLKSFLAGHQLVASALPYHQEGTTKIKKWLEEYKLSTDITIKVSDEIGVPLAYGFMQSGILLPVDFDLDQQENAKQIMLHECMHIKYFHARIKVFLAVLVMFNWFNPCAWILFQYMNRDLEIFCDRHVIALLGRKQRESYALNLLNASQMQYKDSIVYSGFAKDSIKERIVAIMSFKKMSLLALIVSLSIPVSVATVFATTDNRVEGNELKEVEVIAHVKTGQPEEEISLFVDSEELTKQNDGPMATQEGEKYDAVDYEYKATSMPPEKLTLSFEDNGNTYRGIFTMYEMQVKNGTYYGHYQGSPEKI